jgi:hypothetical protein
MRTVLIGKPEEKRPLGRRRLRWESHIKIVLKGAGCEVSSMFSTGSKEASHSEHSNEHSIFITGRKFIDKLSNYQLLTNDSALSSERFNIHELRRVLK